MSLLHGRNLKRSDQQAQAEKHDGSRDQISQQVLQHDRAVRAPDWKTATPTPSERVFQNHQRRDESE